MALADSRRYFGRHLLLTLVFTIFGAGGRAVAAEATVEPYPDYCESRPIDASDWGIRVLGEFLEEPDLGEKLPDHLELHEPEIPQPTASYHAGDTPATG